MLMGVAQYADPLNINLRIKYHFLATIIGAIWFILEDFLSLSNWRKIETVTGTVDIIIATEGPWHLLARNEDQATICLSCPVN